MKKIPKSITVTVRNGDNFRATRPGKTYEGAGVEYDGVLDAFPGTPPPPYRLTYQLDKQGDLYIECDDDFANVYNNSGAFSIVACFPPLSWDGLRVSRRVEKVKK